MPSPPPCRHCWPWRSRSRPWPCCNAPARSIPANGFPAWYQDANGLALQLCMPGTLADLNAGICPVFAADLPAGALPEVFPANWAHEHFYYMVTTDLPMAGRDKNSGLPMPGAGRFVFVGGIEATFNTPDPEAGQQITFNRWRARVVNPACSGSYTFHTPHRAPKTVAGVAGVRISDTEDIGIGPGFDGALQGSTGPFALRAATPGGQRAVMPGRVIHRYHNITRSLRTARCVMA